MNLAGSLRAAAAQFGGARDDYDEDDYDDYGDERGEHQSPAYSASARDARPLALVRPRRVVFALIAPKDFDDAQPIADHLRAGDPVIVDLQGCDAGLRKRLTDFFSGLTYAVEGSVEWLGEQVLLLAPSAVELSAGVGGGPRERRFLNQA
jgi:cell division inhibitor SepF